MKFLPLFLLLISMQVRLGFAQSGDYLNLPLKNKLFSCGQKDTNAAKNFLTELLSLDPDSITRNKQVYFHDLGLCYYKLYEHSSDSNRLNSALQAFTESVAIDSTYAQSLWNLALVHLFKGNCPIFKAVLNQYIHRVPLEMQDKKEIKKLLKRKC